MPLKVTPSSSSARHGEIRPVIRGTQDGVASGTVCPSGNARLTPLLNELCPRRCVPHDTHRGTVTLRDCPSCAIRKRNETKRRWI